MDDQTGNNSFTLDLDQSYTQDQVLPDLQVTSGGQIPTTVAPAPASSQSYGADVPTQPGIIDDDATVVTDQSMALPLTTGPVNQLSSSDFMSDAPTTVGMEITDRRKQWIMIGAGVLAVIALGFLLMPSDDMGESDGFLEGVFASLGLVDDSLQISNQQTAKPIANTVVQEPQLSARPGVAPDNPYWELPNHPGVALDTQREWTRDEELFWTDGMSHPFNFQRYRTIQEVRKFRLKGSEKILYQGLKEKKLWLRMAAAMGLADLGVAVDVDTVEEIIASTRPTLLRNYFKRFKHRGTRGEMFILRHALKLVDASTRLIILRALARSKDSLRPLYLTAATYDPGPGISPYAYAQLGRIGVNPEKYKNMQAMITGGIPFSDEFSGAPDLSPETKSARRVDANEFVQEVQYFSEKEGGSPLSARKGQGSADGFDDMDVIEINLEE